jgi:hypothetical protein
MSSPVPKDPRQREIARRLEFLGGAPSTYFRDASELMSRPSELGSVTHLVAHLLRETEGALRGALREMVPEAERAEKGPDFHRRDIEPICDVLRIAADDGVRELWRSLTKRLHSVAHRSGLAAPRPLNQDFEEFWEGAQAVLHVVTKRVEASYAEQLPRIEELARGAPDLSRFRDAMLHSVVALDRFFDLAGVEWLGPLRDDHYFDRPPPLEANEDGQYVFPRWPPGPYLVRMADEDPQAIIEIGRNLQTDNPEAQQSLVEAACRINPADAIRMVAAIEGWLASTPVQWSLPYKTRDLIAGLIGAGFLEEGLSLTRALLTSPGASGDDGIAAEHLAWLVEEIFPTAGIGGLELAVEMLAAQLDSEGEGRAEYSSIWRPRIDAERLRGDRDTVVSAVRDAATTLATRGVPLAEILAVLEAPGLQIARRIALDLLARHPEPSLAEARLTDRDLLEDGACRREFKALAEAAFPDLTPSAKERLLGWIEEARPYAEEEDERRGRLWQLRILSALGPLPRRWADLRGDLEEEFGSLEPEPPELSRGGYIGALSPLPEDDLLAMGLGALVDYLADFEPEEGWEAPTREGLARTLEEAVAKEPGDFALAAGAFAKLDPSYARALLGGLKEALAQGRVFEWAQALELMRMMTTKSRESEVDALAALDRDPGWSWAWRGSIDLIIDGLYSKLSPIPRELRPRALEVIAFHLENPDPDVDEEGEERDPATVALGSLRCQALEAAVALALFDHRSEAAEHLDPDLARLLEDRLDPRREPSPAVRSVFGGRFSDLMVADERWAREHVEAIFPSEGAPRLWRAAWEGHVERSHPYPLLLEVLEPHYRRGVEEISAAANEDRYHDPDEALVAQLMSLYISGTLTLTEPGGLLPRFYELASAERRGQAISILGRSLENFSPLSPEVEERMRELVEWRLAALDESGDPDELEGWSWWFSSGEFDVEWSLDFLARMLRAGGSLGPDHMVADRLAVLSATYPLACVEVLTLVVEAGVRPWFVVGSEAEIETILVAALAGEGEAPGRARDLVNILVARGAIGFARLLPGREGKSASDGQSESAPE